MTQQRNPNASRPKAAPKQTFKDRAGAFRRAKEAAQAKVQTMAYYGADERQRLSDDMATLWLHGAGTSVGKFGNRWELEISEGETPDGDHAILTLATNSYRDTLFGELDFSEGPIGPLMLTKIVMKSGNEAWDLIEHTGI